MASDRSRNVLKAILYQQRRGDEMAWHGWFSRRPPAFRIKDIESATSKLGKLAAVGIALDNAVIKICNAFLAKWGVAK